MLMSIGHLAKNKRILFCMNTISQGEIPYFEDKKAPLQSDKPTEERNMINAIVFDRSTNSVICLDWPKLGVRTFISGGIEDGEDPIIAAMREIREETGYQNLKFIAEVGKTKATYYAAHKSVNRVANNIGLLFELEDQTKKEIDEAETVHHTMVWIPKDDVEKFIDVDSQKCIWKKAQEVL